MDDSVSAPLNYLARRVAGLATYTYDPPGGGPRFNGELRAYPALIRNARALPDEGFAQRGFCCVRRPSAVRDFLDDAEVRATGYPEAARWVADALGASQAIVFDHTFRQRAPDRPPLDGSGGSFSKVRTPVGRVHADFTPHSAPRRIAALLGVGPDDPLPPYRIIGLWRPLNRGGLQDAPLALAAADSVRPEELVPNAIVYPERRGETYAVLHSERHRWYYYPRMERDEALLFLHYDARSGSVRTVPHTAFEDPDTPPDAEPRASVEMRVLVI